MPLVVFITVFMIAFLLNSMSEKHFYVKYIYISNIDFMFSGSYSRLLSTVLLLCVQGKWTSW